MQTNDHKIVDYDAVLYAKFGKGVTPSRIKAEEKAFCVLYRSNHSGSKERSKNDTTGACSEIR